MIARILTVAFATSLLAACGPSPPPPSTHVAVTRPAGSWNGTGSMTIGFNSDSGRFRVRWQTRQGQFAPGGTFKLTVHSAVSGRPIQAIADHSGEGSGATDVADDPRPYNFMVESANLEWSISVDEVLAAPAPPQR